MSRFTNALKLLPVVLLIQGAFAFPNLEQAVDTTVSTAVTTVADAGQAVETIANSGVDTVVGSDGLFAQLHTAAPFLKSVALKDALHAYEVVNQEHLVKNPRLTVVDYSLPSNQKRMWVFDMNSDKLLFKTYVAHGKNSGFINATRFSNQDSSKESCLGTFVTDQVYYGKHGKSLRIQGLEKGYNDHALSRDIVVHSAAYVAPDYIKNNGHAGRSWGCLALGPQIAQQIIQTIKGGSVIFSYYPDAGYLAHSQFA
jgi:hypothetical protein